MNFPLSNMANREKTLVAKNDSPACEILKNAGINPETVLIFIGDRPVPDDFIVKKGEKFTVLEITSSG